LATLRSHAERARGILTSYQELIDESSDEGIRYLGRLIIEDEERHHELINEMANRVDSWALGISIEPATPSPSPRVAPELLEATLPRRLHPVAAYTMTMGMMTARNRSPRPPIASGPTDRSRTYAATPSTKKMCAKTSRCLWSTVQMPSNISR